MAELRLEVVCCWRGVFQEQLDGHFGYQGGQAQLCSFSPFLTFAQLRAALTDVSAGYAMPSAPLLGKNPPHARPLWPI